MMGDLIRILQESELERETKLRIIEIVSVSQEEELVKELIEILKQWDAGDNQAEVETLAEFKKIEQKYEKDLKGIERKTSIALERIEDEVEKKDGIANIKKSILEK